MDGAVSLHAHGWPHLGPMLVAHHCGASFVVGVHDPARDLEGILVKFPLSAEDEEALGALGA